MLVPVFAGASIVPRHVAAPQWQAKSGRMMNELPATEGPGTL